jgi:hypothetical protein
MDLLKNLELDGPVVRAWKASPHDEEVLREFGAVVVVEYLDGSGQVFHSEGVPYFKSGVPFVDEASSFLDDFYYQVVAIN